MHRSLVRSIGSLIGIGGVAFSITLLSQSMRSVEAVGGSCASGGPYAISRPCPSGVAGAFPLAIFGGLVFLGLFIFCASDKGRTVAMLSWSALFLALAWNFIDYGLKGGSAGGAGFLVPGVLFVIMGAVPLYWVVPSMVKAFLGTDDDTGAPQRGPYVASSGGGLANLGGSPTPAWGGATPSWPTSAPTFSTPPTVPTSATSARVSPAPTATATTAATGDLATELERLASLHRRGELSDAEYESAKQQALSHGGTT
jgi:Short C-terminal domain